MVIKETASTQLNETTELQGLVQSGMKKVEGQITSMLNTITPAISRVGQGTIDVAQEVVTKVDEMVENVGNGLKVALDETSGTLEMAVMTVAEIVEDQVKVIAEEKK